MRFFRPQRGWTARASAHRDRAGPGRGHRNRGEAEREMATIPTIEAPLSTAPLNRPEIRIIRSRRWPRNSASRPTPSPRRSGSVRSAMSARTSRSSMRATTVPIRVQLPESVRGDRRLIDVLKVPAKDGVAVPLSAVADIEFGRARPLSTATTARCASPSRAICRHGRARRGARRRLRSCRRRKNLPPGVSIQQTGTRK